MNVNALVKKSGAFEWLCPPSLTLILIGREEEEEEEVGEEEVEYKGVNFNTLSYTNTQTLGFSLTYSFCLTQPGL